jgi:RimJ/RimL family protein N-acetyltransferase
LKGELLDLRPMHEVDFDALYGVASDPLIWELHPNRDRYKPDVFRNFFDKAIASKGALVVLDAHTREIIGSSRYYDLDPTESEVAIGYTFLARKAWGSVHNREMKKLMLDHAFQFVDTVLFHIGENNFRSRKAVEKIGAEEFSQIESDSEVADGPKGRSIVYRIRKELWRRSDAR